MHRDENRYGYFAERRSHPAVFDEGVKSWVVVAPEDIDALLRRPELKEFPTDGVAIHEYLEKRLDRGLPNLRFAFAHLPLCLEGAEHRSVRRAMAEYLTERRGAMATAVPRLVDQWLGVLETKDEIELVTEVLEPLVGDLIGALTGIDLSGKPTLWRVSSVFDRLIGFNKRLEQEDAVAALRELIREKIGANGSEEEEVVILSYLVLGRNSLGGTLCESLYRLLAANEGRKLSEIPFPVFPNETGVPYIERIVTADIEQGGVSYRAGDRVRLQMQSLAYSDRASERARIFGIGAHACLGKQLSMDVWGAIGRKLAGNHRRVTVRGYAVRTWDFIFTCPTKIQIGLSA